MVVGAKEAYLHWELLDLVATGEACDARATEIAASAELSSGALLMAAAHHKLLPALVEFIEGCDAQAAFTARSLSPLRQLHRANRHKAAYLTEVAVDLDRNLRATGIPFAWTKGVVLQHTLYGNDGTRVLNDMDMMVPVVYCGEVSRALEELGYAAAHTFDRTTGGLVPLSRRERLIYKVSPDHLPHFLKTTDDIVVPLVTLDVAHSLTWHQSEWVLPLEVAFEQVEAVSVGESPDRTLTGLLPTHSFLFVCLHLFREAWFESGLREQDVTLAQFGEVVRFWGALDARQRMEVEDLVRDYRLEEPVGWVVGNVDALFGTELSRQTGLDASIAADWLHTAKGTDGRLKTWHGSMRDRMRACRPPKLT